MRWPNIQDVAAELRSINSEVSEEIDEETGEPYGIEVRLQVLPNGDWQVWWGDPQYDTDHRGYWGASQVPGSGRRFNSKEIARDLIEEAKDMYAQGP